MSIIKVLNITPHGNIGGRERQLYLLAKQFSRTENLKFDVFFIRRQGEFYNLTSKLNIRIYSPKYGALDPRYFIYIYRVFRHYDILNFWGINIYLFFIALIAKKRRTFVLGGTRAVMKKRGLKDLFRKFEASQLPNADSKHKIQFQGIIGIRIMIDHIVTFISRIRRYARKYFLIYFLMNCELIITPSEYLKGFCINYLKVKKQKIVVINNSLDFDDIKITESGDSIRKRLNLPYDTFIVGLAARLDPRKRLDRLVRSLSLIDHNMNIKLIIYGDGSEIEKRKIINQINTLGLTDKVLLLGERKDIYNYINILDFYVLPSDSEGMSLAIVESLYLSKLTAVFRDGGGVHEVIKNGVTGFIVDDEEDLARLIERAYRNEIKNKQHILETGLNFVRKNFDVAQKAIEYRNEFVNLLRRTQ